MNPHKRQINRTQLNKHLGAKVETLSCISDIHVWNVHN